MLNTNNNIIPVPGYILVKPVKQEKTTTSGIVLPDSHEDKPQQGEVIKVGEDYMTDYGIKKSSPCKVGDIVVYKEWGGKEYKSGEIEYMILKFEDVMAVIK